MTARRQADLLKAVVEAHTDLTVFASIVSILEGGTVSARAQPDDFKIIAMCQRAQQRCLTRYDKARDALSAADGSKAT